jgi:NodT family efflux transporter outer membrane factor (OMF) lipoprotein
MKRTIILYCVTLCLASCASYNKYTRSQINTNILLDAKAELPDTVKFATFSWKEFFTDKKLQSLIDTGLVYNSDLHIASLRVQEAEATLKASRLAYLPSASFVPQGQLSGFNGESTTKTHSLALSASWEIDIIGRLANKKNEAVASVNMNRAYRQAVQTQLVATIANSYYTLLMLDEQLEISHHSLESWSETLRTLQVQKNVGNATEAAVSQARANQLTVKSSLLTLQQQIKKQENALSVLLGMPPHPIERTKLTAQSFPEQISIGIPLQVLNNRPDIRQVEYALQRAFYASNIAHAAFYPQMTIGGTLGWTNNSGTSIANPGKWLWNAICSLTQPLFNRGINRANLKIAKARQEEALTTFQQKLLQAGAEVNNALTQWQTAQQRLIIDKEQISTLQSTVRSTRLLMQHSDTSSYLEVLTAQQTLLQAELTEKQNLFNKIQGIINLYHALGGGENSQSDYIE